MSELVERLRETHAQLRKFVYESALGNGHEPSRLLRLARDQLSDAADALERAQKALRHIADNYEDGATLSGTQCAEIAREALGDPAP